MNRIAEFGSLPWDQSGEQVRSTSKAPRVMTREVAEAFVSPAWAAFVAVAGDLPTYPARVVRKFIMILEN